MAHTGSEGNAKNIGAITGAPVAAYSAYVAATYDRMLSRSWIILTIARE